MEKKLEGMAQTANLQIILTSWLKSQSMWTTPRVDMTCFKNTFAFTVKTGLLQVTVATSIQIGLAKRYRSEVRLVAQCNSD